MIVFGARTRLLTLFVDLKILPITDLHLGLIIPLGRRWKSNSAPSTTTVCPALFPPCEITVIFEEPRPFTSHERINIICLSHINRKFCNMMFNIWYVKTITWEKDLKKTSFLIKILTVYQLYSTTEILKWNF